MEHSFFQSKISICLATAFCMLSILSCNKDNTSSSSIKRTIKMEEISTGSCTISGNTYEGATLYYAESLGEYYLHCFFKGEGLFCFKWDKTTNKISLVDCATGLYNYSNPIYFLSQSAYETEMGASASPSYYNPESNTFTFNVMYETANFDGTPIMGTMAITYIPSKAK